MYLLIEVAGYINTLPTIGMVMLTAVIGVYLLKRQGVATLTRGMRRLDGGELPAQEMAEGLLLAVAGALLITPGFITDTVGFLLLFPPTRQLFAQLMLTRVQLHAVGTSGPHSPHPQNGPERTDGTSTTIEGEFQRRN